LFQGNGRQFFEKKAEFPIKKPANCRLEENQQTKRLPMGQIAAMAKA
jgi:hypothetical protein